jgi:hypothetical protein
MGIEPTLAAWEAAVLPLNYTRMDAPILWRDGNGSNRVCGRPTSATGAWHLPKHLNQLGKMAVRSLWISNGDAMQLTPAGSAY